MDVSIEERHRVVRHDIAECLDHNVHLQVSSSMGIKSIEALNAQASRKDSDTHPMSLRR